MTNLHTGLPFLSFSKNMFPGATSIFPGLTISQAEEQIRTKRYHTVLSNVRFAGMRDFSLIRLNQSVQPSTPFIVTAAPEDADLASEALKRGSVDWIPTPFNEHEATAVVQLGLWLFQLRRVGRLRCTTYFMTLALRYGAQAYLVKK